MIIAYLVLAHKNPAQVRRLLTKLHADGVSFLLAVNIHSNFLEFKRELKKLPSHISYRFVSPRYESDWGEVGIVRASLQGLKMAMEQSPTPDYVVQISGQCYPIKPIPKIVEHFSSLHGKSIMQCIPFPFPSWPGGGWLRINKYHYHTPSWLPFSQSRREFPADVPARSLRERILNHFLKKRFPLPRVFPCGLIPCGGAQWWAMKSEMAQYILHFHKAHPEALEFHRHTLMPDEIYFSSIIGSSPEWLKTITQTHLHYCDWSKPIHPAILTMDYAPALKNLDGPIFARKFDDHVDSRILDWIDCNLLCL